MMLAWRASRPGKATNGPQGMCEKDLAMADTIMTLERLYKDYASRGARQRKAASVLNQIDWLTCNAEFDPISGMPTPMPLSKFVSRVARRDVQSCDFPRDRLWHLVDHCAESVMRIIRDLNESPARDHELMHIRQVKELDAPSFVKLSTRPGRNVREKLSSNPYLEAVKRYMSVDLAENRLFKAFVRRLYDLLELRYEMMKKVRGEKAEAHPLMDEINRWLRSDVAEEIAEWENTPPNNTLLSHKDYKKVWDAWRWMLTLDEDVNRDYAMENDRELTRRDALVKFWDDYALAWKKSNNVRMAEVPLFVDYDRFEVKVWGDSDIVPLVDNGIRLIEIGDLKSAAKIKCSGSAGQIRRPKEIHEPVCVDLTWLSPRYAIDDKVRTLSVRLIWQNWSEKPEEVALAKNANGVAKNVSFSLFGADAVWQHPDATTIAFADLFAGADCKAADELQWRAAHASAEELNRIFTSETLVWLTPDGISEFELKVIRGNLNAAFKNAQPLPRSIAAIYEKVDFAKLPRKLIQTRGYGVLVLDTTDDGVLATNMTAKYSKELEKRVPSTLGYYWERNPSVLLTDATVRQSALSEIDYIDENGEYRAGSKRKVEWHQFSKDELLCRGDLGEFGYVVNLTTSPVVGGLKVYRLQQEAGDIPLWRDNLPLLSVEVYDKDGLPSNFYLVGAKTGSVVPTANGEEVVIPVAEEFSLPVNQSYYSLPLHQGSGNRRLNFAAYIKPEHPIKEDDVDGKSVRCKLKLTYKYGADDPYRLVFYPVSKAKTRIKPMRVEWRRNLAQMQIEELPVPKFPAAMTWAELQAYPDRTGNGANDLLVDLQNRLEPVFKDEEEILIEHAVNYQMSIGRKYRSQGVVKKCLRDFCFVTVDGKDVYCHYTSFIDGGFSPRNLNEGDDLYLKVVKYTDKRTQETRYKGEYITVDEPFPELEMRDAIVARIATGDARSRTLNWERSQEENPYFRVLETALSRSMFHAYTIWNNGRSLRDVDAPDWFRKFMVRAIDRIAELMNDDNVPERISNKALKFLSCLHVDAFNHTGTIMRYAAYSTQGDDFNRFCTYFPYVMGNLDLPEQNQLFAGVLDRTGNRASHPLKVVSILAWRSNRAIENLTASEVVKICDDLISELGVDYDRLNSKIEEGFVRSMMKYGIRGRKNITQEEAAKEVRRQQCAILAMHLELLLALLRTRGASDPEVKKLFRLDAEYCDRFTKAVQEIGKMVMDKGYALKTRLSLNLDKPVENKMPDLLYALQLYLTGNTGANAISIAGVSDEEEE